MDAYLVMLSPTMTRTRVLVMHGPDELMRAVLPSPMAMKHDRAAMTFLEGLALWLGSELSVVLSVTAEEVACCLGLTDEMGLGCRSLFYRVEVHERGTRRRRGARISGVADFNDLRQLWRIGRSGT